ncbi:hypothetical protein N7486_000638 [Penicillium sp. IBT 16267x]|nr:hypothetical protein N7486_000638 [Penicillium sp. IBT 16267x]
MVNHVHDAYGEAPNDDMGDYLDLAGFPPPEPSMRAYLCAYPGVNPYLKANSFGGVMSHTSAAKSNLNASLSSSYATSHTTGATSVTSANPHGQGASSGMMAHQDPGPDPGVNEADFIFIGGHQDHIDPRYLGPTTIQPDIEEAQLREAGELLDQLSAPRQGLLGLSPVHDSQKQYPKLEELRMELQLLYAVLLDPATESLLSEEDQEQILSHLRQINWTVEKKRNNGHRVSKPSASKPRKTGKCKKKLFRCIKCGTEFSALGSLQRHIEDQHHPCVNIGCPGLDCEEISRRRDKARDHCLIKHEWKPTNTQLELLTTHLECPPHCSVCFLISSDWKAFYRCFISHCGIANASQDEGSSFDDDPGNGGAGSAPDNGSNFPGSGTGVADMSADRGNLNYDGSLHQDWNSCFQVPNGNQNANQYAHGMHRSSSDGNNMVPPRPDTYHDTNQKRRASAQYDSDPLRESQQPGLPQKRSLKRTKQARAEPQENRCCPICGHEFNGCELCAKRPVSVEWCHACYDTMRVQASASSSQVARHTAPSQGSMNPHQVNIIPTQQQRRYFQNFHVPRPVGNGNHQRPRYPGNFGGPIGRPQGPPRGSNDFTNMVVTTYVPELSEEEMLPTGSKSSNASVGGGTWLSCLPIRVPLPRGMVKVPQDTKALEYGAASGAIDRIISQTISETIPPQINLPVAQLGTVSPELCRCPCRTKTAMPTYSSTARVELIPGKLLDMTLTILPEDRVGHPLRTRIRVVVRLLKLRSSVARSGNKKKNKQDAKEIELVLKTSLDGFTPTVSVETKQDEPVIVDESDYSETEDDGTFSDAESVTSSVAEASSVSELALVPFKRSDSDILFPDEPNEDIYDNSDLFSDIPFPDDDSEETSQPNDPSPDYLIDEIQGLSIVDPNSDYDIEETELEISMDLDFQTCLANLSSWTDGLADIEQSGHTITDPARVFEYFFRYIIYVIFALSRSRIEAAGG